jgi:hypothetical protein
LTAIAIQFKRLSQGSDYGAGMKFNLNEDGSKYLSDILGTDMGTIQFDRPLDGNGNEQADLDFSVVYCCMRKSIKIF